MSDETTTTLEESKKTKAAPESPLLLIRQKELEISGNVLAARREGETTVATARKQAAEIVASATEKKGLDTSATEKSIAAESEVAVTEIKAGADVDIAAIRETVESRRSNASTIVLDLVLGE